MIALENCQSSKHVRNCNVNDLVPDADCTNETGDVSFVLQDSKSGRGVLRSFHTQRSILQ